MVEPQKAYGLAQATARAKINLTLHVGRVVEDQESQFFGYHPVDSLVVFADFGDILGVEAAPETRLTLQGPYSRDLAEGRQNTDDNLILRALRYTQDMSADRTSHFAFDLVKNLPIASGIGGGSADAAAALKLLEPYFNLTECQWHEIAVKIGADVPVCRLSETAFMRGIGEQVTPLPGLGTINAILVNPNKAVSTGKIFKAFDGDLAPDHTLLEQAKTGNLLSRARAGRNDLEAAAIALCPDIARVINLIAAQDGCELTRMSGSGATCFGLFPDAASAQNAAQHVKSARPDWWVKPCKFGQIA